MTANDPATHWISSLWGYGGRYLGLGVTFTLPYTNRCIIMTSWPLGPEKGRDSGNIQSEIILQKHSLIHYWFSTFLLSRWKAFSQLSDNLRFLLGQLWNLWNTRPSISKDAEESYPTPDISRSISIIDRFRLLHMSFNYEYASTMYALFIESKGFFIWPYYSQWRWDRQGYFCRLRGETYKRTNIQLQLLLQLRPHRLWQCQASATWASDMCTAASWPASSWTGWSRACFCMSTGTDLFLLFYQCVHPLIH